MGETYESAGVSLAAGEQAVERIREHVRATFRPEVIGDIGGFGGLFRFDAGRFDDPVLVSSTDGVGTKLLVARAARRLDTIGIDLVAMCVDDIAVQGAEPLFFLDYISAGRVEPQDIEDLVAGVAHGCKEAGCALIGGEIAEHPGAMEPGEYDLVGFAVGAVDRGRIVTGERIHAGDRLLALPSPGLRSNGYSLARRVLLERAGRHLDDPAWTGAHHSLADELLTPSVIYAPAVRSLLADVDVHGLVHVTGGGLPGNLPRVLPRHCDAVVRVGTWEVPRIFGEIQRHGEVADDEMARVFNLGVGMVAVVPPDEAFRAIDVLRGAGHQAVEIGEVIEGHGRVVLDWPAGT
jgi:phosphoribosylformylglycinamidine cyclo-ligase